MTFTNRNDPFLYSNKKTLSITLPMLLSNSLFLVMSWTDILMLSYFESESQVGIYNAAVKIAALNGSVLVAVNSIAMPKFVELFEKKDMLVFKNFVKRSTLLVLIFSTPLLVIIGLFAGFLMGMLGLEFIAGSKALIILALGQFIMAISGATIQILNMTGKENIAKNILLCGVLINLGLNFFLIPLYGINGAAIATTCTTFFWNILGVIFIYNKLGFLTYPLYMKIKL